MQLAIYCGRFPVVTTGRDAAKECRGRPQSPLPAPAGAEPLRRRSGKPQSSRRGAPVARRDPRKGKHPKRSARPGVERAEGPSRDPRAAPLAGVRRAVPSGRVQGQSPWRLPYFAYSVDRVSRMTLTRIWPGYSISFSMRLAISLARILVPSSVTSSGLTIMRTSRPD